MKKMITLFILIGLMTISSTMVAAEPSLPKVQVNTIATLPDGHSIIADSIKLSDNMRKIAFVSFTDNTHKTVQINDQTSPVYYAVHPGFPIWSADSEKYAYIAYKNKDECVVVVNGETIDNLGYADNFIFSTFGKRYAFRAQKNNKQFVVVDGTPGTPYTGIVIKDNFRFSLDEKRLFYVAFKNNSCIAVIDGQEEPNAYTLIEEARFSPDSKQYAYKGRTEKKGLGDGKWCVVLNGKAGNVYDRIFDLFFSLDSKHLAYTAVKDRKMLIVLDQKELAPHDIVGLPVFSADSKSFAYGYADKDKWYIQVNDKKFGSFDKVYKFYFSLDSQRNAFFAKEDDEWLCLIDGEKGPTFKKIVEAFRFSPDSSRYAYTGANEDKSRIITDGTSGPEYQSVGEPYFSPDSRHLVYRAFILNKQHWITVLDGKESAKGYFGIGQYTFSPDSKHLAFPATNSIDSSMMVVDRVEQCSDQNFKILGEPAFSPDGDYVVYHARAKGDKWHLIVNGHLLPETYGGFYKGTPIIFDSPNHFHTIGIKPGGKEFVVIDVEIPETFKLTSGINHP